MTSDLNKTMETIEQEIADECLDDLILNTINTIRKNRKRPDTSSIQEHLHKKLNNCNVTAEIIESRLSFLTKKNKIENKLTNGKSSYFIKDQTSINEPIQPNISDQSSPLNCKTSRVVKILENQISENANMLLEDKIASLEENISVLNTEITALRSFIIEQLLVIKESAKETSIDSSLSQSNSLRDEITYLRNECKTKNCIIQSLLENQNVFQKTVNTGKLEPFIVPKKFASNIRTPLANPISTSNSFKLLSENFENIQEANHASTTETNTVKDSKTKNANTSNAPKKKRNNKDENKDVTAIVGDCIIKDGYGWELSDKENKVVVKQFSGSTTEDMKTYIQPPLKRDPDRVIIHVGTNDLRSNQDPETIAKNIIDIAKSSKTNKNEILLSSIVPRRDSLNGKGK